MYNKYNKWFVFFFSEFMSRIIEFQWIEITYNIIKIKRSINLIWFSSFHTDTEIFSIVDIYVYFFFCIFNFKTLKNKTKA